MKKTFKLPIILCAVLLLLTLMVGQEADALDTGIYAAGKLLTPDVKYITSGVDGSIIEAGADEEFYNVFYESSSKTLYLDRAYLAGSTEGAALFINTGEDITVHLKNANTLKGTGTGPDGIAYGLKAEGSLVTLSGGYSLRINESGFSGSIGIKAKALRITDSTMIDSRGGAYGVYVTDSFEMTDNNTKAELQGGIQSSNIKPAVTGDFSVIVDSGPSEAENVHVASPKQTDYHTSQYAVTQVVNPVNPLADFTATGYSTGVLTPRRDNLVYRVDPESEDSPFAPLTEAVRLENLHDGSIIQIKVMNDLSFRANSDIMTITIRRMAMPEFTKTDSNGENSPGSILLSGSENFERLKDDGTWEDCGNAFPELTPGKYSFRSKADGEYLASDTLEVEIADLSPKPSPGTGGSGNGGNNVTGQADIPYRFTYHANGCWYYDIGGDYTVQCTGPADLLDGVYLNGVKVDPRNYLAGKAEDGSTIISFYEFFMKSLPHANYQKLSVTYSDGKSAQTNLHVLSRYSAPVTGDTENTAAWLTVLALSAEAAALLYCLWIHTKSAVA